MKNVVDDDDKKAEVSDKDDDSPDLPYLMPH